MIVAASMMLAAAGAVVEASPWAEAGDRQLRSDIELLARHGLIRGPITTWPIPWAQISSRLTFDPGYALPANVEMALARVRDKMPRETDFGRPLLGVDLRGTNRAKLGRDFGDAARDKADIAVSAEMNWPSVSARLKVGYQGDDRGNELAFDGSYLAAALGNWTAYGGWVDRWWGPGWSSSLILSTNARPMPHVGLMRLDPKPFETKWLSWLGSWQFNVTFGFFDDPGRHIPNPYDVTMRLAFNPIPNLEIGLSRVFMICGDGERCGFSTWTRALIGVGNLDNPKNPGEPDASNQLAGFDVRYAFGLTDKVSMAVYGQMIGEDETALLPFKYAGLAGFSLDGPWGDKGASWKFISEYTTTVAFLDSHPGVMYNHYIYRSGYRYNGVVIGDRFDTDSRALYFTGIYTDSKSWAYRLAYQRAHVNVDNLQNALSANEEHFNIFQAGLDVPSDFGRFGLELRYEDDRPNTPGRKVSTKAIEASWSARF